MIFPLSDLSLLNVLLLSLSISFASFLSARFFCSITSFSRSLRSLYLVNQFPYLSIKLSLSIYLSVYLAICLLSI